MPEEVTVPSGTEQEAPVTQSGTETAAATSTEDKKSQKLSEEAAAWRTKFRALEKELADLQTQRQSSDAPTSAAEKSELATVKRQLENIQSQLKAAEEKSKAAEEKVRKKTLQASLSSIAAKSQFTDTTSAIELLEKRARVADDDAVVFVIKNEDGKEIEIEATAENVRKHNLLPAIFFPADGVAGSGSKGSTKPTTAGIDLERAKTDRGYYLANREAIKKALSARQ
jgi:hypothetical protein